MARGRREDECVDLDGHSWQWWQRLLWWLCVNL